MIDRNWVLSCSFLALASCLGGCEEKPEAEEKTAAAEQAEEPAAEAPQEKSAEELAREKAEAEAAAKKEEEEAAAQKEVDENPITECCRALGKKGFTERSPEYMAASKVCGESLEAKEEIGKALPGIKTALKGQPLPSECSE
jgi:hypothetical protein